MLLDPRFAGILSMWWVALRRPVRLFEDRGTRGLLKIRWHLGQNMVVRWITLIE